MHYHITGYFSQVQIFPNGEPLVLAEIFLIQKFMSLLLKISHEQHFVQSLQQSVYQAFAYKCLAMPSSMVVYVTQLSICAELSSRPTIACSICYIQLATTFTLKLYNYQLQLHASIDLNLTARTIHNTHMHVWQLTSYTFSISSCKCSRSILLHNRALRWIQQVNFREILCLLQLPPMSNGDPQSNFIQHTTVNFLKL